MTLFSRLQEAVAVTLNVPPGSIKETSADKDIAAWDSVGHVNVMMAVEDTFGIRLEVEDFARLNSIPAILDHLRRHPVD